MLQMLVHKGGNASGSECVSWCRKTGTLPTGRVSAFRGKTLMKIIVYEKPTCTTCRNLAALFRENGIDYDKVNYFIDTLTAEQLKRLLKKLGIPAFDLLRKKEPAFKDLGITESSPEDKIIAAIIDNPGLLNRPIVEVGDRAVIARPIDQALDLIRSAR